MKHTVEKREDAVSPVVGVMLMLVVVIIIAAVVSAFAGGLTEKTEKAPTVSMDVKIDLAAADGMGGTVPKIAFKHLSGDVIPTKDLQIITYFTNQSGYTYKHTQSILSNATVLYSPGLYSPGGDARIPYHADMTEGYAHSNPETKDFGNFTFRTGDIMSTGNLRGTAELLGMTWTAGTYPTPDSFNDPSLKPGSVIDVKILHKPSSKYIFDKEVVAI